MVSSLRDSRDNCRFGGIRRLVCFTLTKADGMSLHEAFLERRIQENAMVNIKTKSFFITDL